MPVDFINISSIWPTDGNPLGVNGDLNIVGVSPRYLVNGSPMGMVSTISPGGLSGAVTLSAGANMSITQSGQTITFASTGGGSGGTSQWIDAVGGGIYYGGHVGILNADPEIALDVNGLTRVTGLGAAPTTGMGVEIYSNVAGGNIQTYDRDLGLMAPTSVFGDPIRLNQYGGNVGIGTQNPSLGSLQIARSDGGYQLVLERSGPNDPQIYGIGIPPFAGNPSLFFNDVTRSATRMCIAPNGNVGIGTTNPGAPLDVERAAALAPNGQIFWGNGAGAQGALYADAVNIGIGSVSAIPLIFYTGNGAAQMTLTTAGNVGIGTTGPSGRLQINAEATALVPQIRFRPPDGNPDWSFDIGFGVNYGSWKGYLNVSEAGLPTSLLLNPNGGNVGVGTSNPGNRLQVEGGRSYFVNSAEPHCIGVSGQGGSTMWLGTVWDGSFVMSNAGGVARMYLTQGGTMTVNGGSFDPGNPHLQVTGGLTVNSMADNNLACIRMVSNDQAWGLGWHMPGGTAYLFCTNPWDAYGGWANFPMHIDCATGNVTFPQNVATGSFGTGNLTANGNIQCNGTVNAAAFTINGVPISTGMTGDWIYFPVNLRNPVGGGQLAANWANCYYRVFFGQVQYCINFSYASAANSVDCGLPVQVLASSTRVTYSRVSGTSVFGPATLAQGGWFINVGLIQPGDVIVITGTAQLA